jgi:hypothetical protein
MQGGPECGLESVKAHGQGLDENAKTCVNFSIKIFLRHYDKKICGEFGKTGKLTLNLCNEVYRISFVVTK